MEPISAVQNIQIAQESYLSELLSRLQIIVDVISTVFRKVIDEISNFPTYVRNFLNSFQHASSAATKRRSEEHDRVRYLSWSSFLNTAWFGNSWVYSYNSDLKGALRTNDVRFHDVDGATILHAAVLANNFDGVQACLEAGADVNAKEMRGQTPLHWAAKKGYVQLMGLLIAHGADVNATDLRGKTALRLAAKYGCKEAIACLTAGGAFIDTIDAKGETPFLVACKQGRMITAEYLRHLGANTKVVNKDGKSFPNICGKAGFWAYARFILSASYVSAIENPLNQPPSQITATRAVAELRY